MITIPVQQAAITTHTVKNPQWSLLYEGEQPPAELCIVTIPIYIWSSKYLDIAKWFRQQGWKYSEDWGSWYGENLHSARLKTAHCLWFKQEGLAAWFVLKWGGFE